MPAAQIEALIPHKVNPGSRPSTLVLFRQLDPATLGRLIALYEHSVLTQSVVWGINAFDQWGVELGKKLTEQLAPAVQDPRGGHPAPAAVMKLLATRGEVAALSCGCLSGSHHDGARICREGVPARMVR